MPGAGGGLIPDLGAKEVLCTCSLPQLVFVRSAIAGYRNCDEGPDARVGPGALIISASGLFVVCGDRAAGRKTFATG